jgi:hypothetical protein
MKYPDWGTGRAVYVKLAENDKLIFVRFFKQSIFTGVLKSRTFF